MRSEDRFNLRVGRAISRFSAITLSASSISLLSSCAQGRTAVAHTWIYHGEDERGRRTLRQIHIMVELGSIYHKARSPVRLIGKDSGGNYFSTFAPMLAGLPRRKRMLSRPKMADYWPAKARQAAHYRA
jgi:hypothetical protein